MKHSRFHYLFCLDAFDYVLKVVYLEVIMGDLNSDIIANACRSCLGSEQNMHFIFDDNISELFEKYAGIQILRDDELPKHICQKCVDELKITDNFRTRALQVNTTLIEYINTKHKGTINDNSTDLQDECSSKMEILLPSPFAEELNEDIKRESDVKTACYICNEGVYNSDEMIVHKEKHFLYKCKKCELSFNSLDKCKHHKCTKDLSDNGTVDVQKVFKCHICDRELMYSRSLRHHLRIHTGEKPCLCTMCGLKFREEKALINHIRAVHTKETRFICTFCPKSFTVSGKRREHERIHTGEKPYQCTHCSRLFGTRCALTAHTRRHSKQIVYNCMVQNCGKGFYSFSSYQRHTWAHRGERPYECNKCQKTYLSKQNLLAHQKSVHSQLKDQICHICSKIFSATSTLNRHLRSIHKTEPLKSKKPIAVFANSPEKS